MEAELPQLWRYCPHFTNTKRQRKQSDCCALCVCVFVCIHQGMTEGPEEWFLSRDSKFQVQLLSISEALLFFELPLVPGVSVELLWNTTHQMRCDSHRHTVLFILDGTTLREGCKKVLTCCLMRSGGSPSPWRRLGNFHPRVEEWMGDPPHPSIFPWRQRKTVHNYLVWNFIAACVCGTGGVGVTELIFDGVFEDTQHSYCVDCCVRGALPWVKREQHK